MSATITEYQTQTFQLIACWKCNVQYFIPDTLYQNRLMDKEPFFCPNGHSGAFVESWKDKCAKVEEEARVLRTKLYLEQDQRAAAERATERLKRRVKAGVCPCCQRSFQSLCRHIKTKHPNYAKQPANQAE